MKFLFYNQNKSFLYLPSIMLLIIIPMALIYSCSNDEERPELDNIDFEVEIKRLEKDLFSIDIENVAEQVPRLEDNYGDFFDIYNNLIIRIGSSSSPGYSGYLKSFLTDFDIYRLHGEVERIFPDLDELESELTMAFRHYNYYFPDRPVPQIYTYISGFNQSVVAAENIFGIGLDKYLGSGHQFYLELQLPNYQRANMNPSKIPSDSMIGWAMSEFELDERDAFLLSHILYQGKLMEFASMMLPDEDESIITGISPSGLEWCRENEEQMWTYLVENKLLFSTNMRTIAKFTNEGPFTAEFSRESPARAAVWLGWQIVRSFRERNKNISIQELMNNTDYQGILNEARYRP